MVGGGLTGAGSSLIPTGAGQDAGRISKADLAKVDTSLLFKYANGTKQDQAKGVPLDDRPGNATDDGSDPDGDIGTQIRKAMDFDAVQGRRYNIGGNSRDRDSDGGDVRLAQASTGTMNDGMPDASTKGSSPSDAFFAPLPDNPRFQKLKDAGLLRKDATVADFYNLKYDLEGKSLGAVETIAEQHGLTLGELTTSLTTGSQALGDRAFNVFKSFLANPGFVGGNFAEHEAGLRQAMLDAGVKPEHTEKLFEEMLDIGGYTDDPVNGFANEYEYKKTVTAWTQGLGVIGNGGGIAVTRAGPQAVATAKEVATAAKEVGLDAAAASRRAALTRFGTLPQGVTKEQFLQIQQIAGKAADDIGGTAYVHGSRASATAKTASDIDVKIVVDQKTFDDAWQKAFGDKNLGSAAWKTGQRALEDGRIFARKAGLADVRDALQSASGKKVDISIVVKDGVFDTKPHIGLK